MTRRAGDRGSASVEFAVTAVAVLTLIFAAIQAATYYWARSIAVQAAHEAVTAQRAYDAPPGAGQDRAERFLATTGDGLSGTTVTVASDGQQVTATVSGTCLSVLPGFCAAVGVSATAVGPVERVTPP